MSLVPILIFFGVVVSGMIGSFVASALAFVVSCHSGGVKPLLIAAYTVTTGLWLSFVFSAVVAGLTLAFCSTAGAAFWITVACTFFIRLIFLLGAD